MTCTSPGLHDIGLLVLDQFVPEEFRATCQQASRAQSALWSMEERTLGMDHGEIGGLFLGRWSLPMPIIGAIGGHHHPESVPPATQMAARFIQAAEAVCAAQGLAVAVEGPPEVASNVALEAIGFDQTETSKIMAEVEQIGDWAKHFLGAA